ncbi:MAG: hypothetical protein WBE38_11100 [Terracidiphilus sp.]|jgi:hypothetical protein
MDARSQQAYDRVHTSSYAVDVEAQSHINLANLSQMQLTPNEQTVFTRVVGLPFILEHRSKDTADAGWQVIKGKTKEHGGNKNPDAQLLSLFEVAKLKAVRSGKTSVKGIDIANLAVSDVDWDTLKEMFGDGFENINTSKKDLFNFGNIDFVFYKLGLAGYVNMEKGFAGVASGRPKFFSTGRLLTVGWITLDDWVSHSGSQSFTNDLGQVWPGFPSQGLTVSYGSKTKTYRYTAYTRIAPKPFMQGNQAYKTTQLNTFVKRVDEEVFFGADIFPGIAYTLIAHLRSANPGGEFIAKVAAAGSSTPLISGVMNNIWKLIEAKIPGSMRYYDFHISKAKASGEVALV